MLGHRFLFFLCDVRAVAAVAGTVADTVATFGGIDIVPANACVATYGRVADLREARWDTVLGINLEGGFLLVIARGGGVIIFNASGRAWVALRGLRITPRSSSVLKVLDTGLLTRCA